MDLPEQRGVGSELGAELEGGVVEDDGGESGDKGARGGKGEVGGREEFDAVFGAVGGGFKLLLVEGALVAVVVEVGPAEGGSS